MQPVFWTICRKKIENRLENNKKIGTFVLKFSRKIFFWNFFFSMFSENNFQNKIKQNKHVKNVFPLKNIKNRSIHIWTTFRLSTSCRLPYGHSIFDASKSEVGHARRLKDKDITSAFMCSKISNNTLGCTEKKLCIL